MQKHVLIDGRKHDLALTFEPAQAETFTVKEGARTVTGTRRWNGARLELTIAGRMVEAFLTRGAGGRLEVWLDGERHVVEEERRGATAGAAGPAEEDVLVAPMPAKVVRVTAAIGDDVAEGQTLVVLESMKMELGVTAPRAGRVKAVGATVGEIVPAGTILVELEHAGGDAGDAGPGAAGAPAKAPAQP
jgi:acetyl/propionyl-CoA carboxylase alpha subunit